MQICPHTQNNISNYVKEEMEASLCTREFRRDSLLGTSVLEDLVLFLQEERNSKSCPHCCVAYRLRRDKF